MRLAMRHAPCGCSACSASSRGSARRRRRRVCPCTSASGHCGVQSRQLSLRSTRVSARRTCRCRQGAALRRKNRTCVAAARRQGGAHDACAATCTQRACAGGSQRAAAATARLRAPRKALTDGAAAASATAAACKCALCRAAAAATSAPRTPRCAAAAGACCMRAAPERTRTGACQWAGPAMEPMTTRFGRRSGGLCTREYGTAHAAATCAVRARRCGARCASYRPAGARRCSCTSACVASHVSARVTNSHMRNTAAATRTARFASRSRRPRRR